MRIVMRMKLLPFECLPKVLLNHREVNVTEDHRERLCVTLCLPASMVQRKMLNEGIAAKVCDATMTP